MKLKQKLNASGNRETKPRVLTDNLLNINELDLAQTKNVHVSLDGVF